MKKVADINANGKHFIVKKDDKMINPYRIYRQWYEPTENGTRNRNRLMISVADMASALVYIAQWIN